MIFLGGFEVSTKLEKNWPIVFNFQIHFYPCHLQQPETENGFSTIR